MDRYPGYHSMLARVEQKKVQVKGQLAPEQSHLVDDLVAFMLDQFDECRNVPFVDASTNTNEDHRLSDGSVAREDDTRIDMNEQTNQVKPQVDHHREGSISSGQTVSPVAPPPTVSHSTIQANIKVEGGQSVQLCEYIKKEEDEDGGEYVMECDCEECETCRVKMEMKEELDESGETELGGNSGLAVEVYTQVKKEEGEDDCEVERPTKIRRMDRVIGNVRPVVDVGAEEFDREQIDGDNSALNPMRTEQDGEEAKVEDNQNDGEQDGGDDGDQTMEQLQDTNDGDQQQVPAENFVKRIEPADEMGNKFEYDYRGCRRRMKLRTDLIRHIRTHTGEKPFKCSVEGCDRAFVLDAQLKAHLNVHSGTRPFACSWPECEARFGNKSNFIVHLRTHTGERPFECDQCDSAFTQHSSLVIHLRTHTGSRPFVCTWPQCGQAFICSSHLKCHCRVHSNERQFVCDVTGCAKVFKSKDGLRKHQKAKHS